MAENSEEMFVCGDDFDAILAILEEDEAIDHHFTTVIKSQCRNISRIRNQFRKIEFWFIPPKQPFGMVISENDIKKSPSALHLDNFRKVRKFTKKYNFYS